MVVAPLPTDTLVTVFTIVGGLYAFTAVGTTMYMELVADICIHAIKGYGIYSSLNTNARA